MNNVKTNLTAVHIAFGVPYDTPGDIPEAVMAIWDGACAAGVLCQNNVHTAGEIACALLDWHLEEMRDAYA